MGLSRFASRYNNSLDRSLDETDGAGAEHALGGACATTGPRRFLSDCVRA